jgi:hypothetical protein
VEPELSEREQADLAAYADGSLPRARRRELEARLDASGSLREALERQRAALASVRAAEAEPAPERLRAWLRDQNARRRAPDERAFTGPDRSPGGGAFTAVLGRRRPVRTVVAAAGVAAVVVPAALLAFATAGGPDASDLAAAAERPSSSPAPGNAGELRLAVAGDGIRFPDWAPRLGWRATGTRSDELDGRRAVTVTYERAGREVAYAILGRPALDLPGGDGTYRSFRHDGRPAVAWIRKGRTCLLLGGDGVDDTTLRRLARSVRYY